MCQRHNAVKPVRLESAAPQSRVKHSSTQPLRSHVFENIMENGAFALLEQMLHFQNIFKSIQALT